MKIGTIISLLDKFRNSQERPRCGSTAKYYKIRKGVGLKLYCCKKERNYAYRLQNVFHNKGLAPRIGNKINLPDTGEYGIYIYGYITQHAAMLFEDTELDEQLKIELENKITKNSLQYYDISRRNIGLIRGQCVIVDFDTASVVF